MHQRMMATSWSFTGLAVVGTLTLLPLITILPACEDDARAGQHHDDNLNGTDGGDGSDLGPNDLSVLMPFRRGEPGFHRLIPLSDFLSESIFEQVTETAIRLPERAHFAPVNPDVGSGVWPTVLELPVSGPDGQRAPLGASHLGNWRIISFRFDPCAPPAPHLVEVPTKQATPQPHLPPAFAAPPYDDDADRSNVVDRCTVELRLVAQPFRYYEPETQARDGDTTMHLFYRFGEPGSPDTVARDEILRQLRALKALSPAPTTGPLGVHPGLLADLQHNGGDGGRFWAHVARTLRELTRIGRTRISQIAFMGLRDPVVRGLAGRGEDGGSNMWNFFVGSVDSDDRFTQLDIHPTWQARFESFPAPGHYISGPDNVESINLAGGSGYGSMRTRVSRQEVENSDTKLVTVRNGDCISCHFRGGSDTHLINFGYVSGLPSIARRTIVETDAVVSYVRDLQRR